MHHPVPLACTLVGFVAASVACQTLDWQRTTPPPSLAGRIDSAMAYDAQRQRLVLFGGWTNRKLSDTWEFDGASWREIKSTTSPSARSSHAMVYDSGQRGVVLFGGQDSTGQSLADTWRWDGQAWTRLNLLSSPPARYAHAMAYDTRRKQAVLFGGVKGQNAYFSDTWLFDGKTWKQVNPVASPQGRAAHAITYDATRQRLVLFAGSIGIPFPPYAVLGSDTWEFDGSNWTEIRSATRPRARSNHAIAYDSSLSRTVLYGGSTSNSTADDTWLWDGKLWSQLQPVSRPGPQLAHTMAYDSARQRTVMNNGWEYGAAYFHAYGKGCGAESASLTARSDPKIGTTLTLETWNLSSSVQIGLLALGASRLQLDLSGGGMPGCSLLQSNDVLWGFQVTNGRGSFQLGIPNDKSIQQLKVFFQSIVVDPAANRLGLLTSNGGQVVVQ